MHISATNKPVIILTMGDPAGIGPEITAKALSKDSIRELANFIVVGDVSVFEDHFSLDYIKKEMPARKEDAGNSLFSGDNAVILVDPGPKISSIVPGVSSLECAQKALNSISKSVDIVQDPAMRNIKKAIVTAPVNKERISEVSPGFVGHTEFFKDAFFSDFVTMAFVGEKLKVVPVTRHVPISKVATLLTGEKIEKTIIQVITNGEIISGKTDPIIGVCALNPHAGEAGKIGREEIDVIVPVLDKLKQKYPGIIGPLPADVAFYKAYRNQMDIVVSMYHDQCLGPFKMVDFDCGVNMTLGLDCVRTSPDHGTAFDIAGKGIANSQSLEESIKLAVRALSYSR